MKTLKTILLAFTFLGIAIGCSSDDDSSTPPAGPTFEQLTQADIEALESRMSDAILNASNDTGVLWETGKILLYKTNEGRFGKLKVLNIDPSDNYRLTIEVVTYATDGLIYNSASFFEVPGTFVADLDEIVLSPAEDDEDFWWRRIDETLTRMTPRNTFIFVEYDTN